MTTRTQQRDPTRWVLRFLAALVAVLATILSAATASAALGYRRSAWSPRSSVCGNTGRFS